MSEQAEIKIVTQYKTWEKPACFTDAEQYKDYMWLIRVVDQPLDEENYCLDCSCEYQRKMIAEGRCAHPETKFVKWRTTFKVRNEEGKLVVREREADTLGISNISRFWGSPALDKHQP